LVSADDVTTAEPNAPAAIAEPPAARKSRLKTFLDSAMEQGLLCSIMFPLFNSKYATERSKFVARKARNKRNVGFSEFIGLICVARGI
jgi:hypothetical protein